MLSYALAIVVAISSLVLFSTAFFMSKIHRRDDFLWSAVGLFYALVLWYCARNITGAVLLGQAAATVLLVSYSWQTIKLRQIIADPEKAVATNNFSVVRSANRFWQRKKPSKPQAEVAPAPSKPEMPTVTESEIAIPETPVVNPTQTVKAPPTAVTPDAADKTPPATPEVTTPQVNVADDAAQNVTAPQVNVANDATQNVATPQVNTPEETAETELKTEPTSNLPPVSEPAIANKIEPAPKPLVDIEIIDKAIAQPLPSKLPEADKIELEASSPLPSQGTEDMSETIKNEPTAALPVKEVDKKPASPLDSLETVEVAEVLEAQSDRESNNRRGDRSDEIEVTTTDVNVISEDNKTMDN